MAYLCGETIGFRFEGEYMQVKILDITTDALYNISMAARTCYNSREKDDINKRAEFIKGLIKSGHETPLEFANVTFDVKDISRCCLAQVTRHRIGISFCVESQRYVNQNDSDVILPKSIQDNKIAWNYFIHAKQLAQTNYIELLKLGIPKEDARYILPEGTCTNLTVCFNFRELRHFLKLRLDKHAQWEIRELAKQMKDLMMAKGYGCIVEDIGE